MREIHKSKYTNIVFIILLIIGFSFIIARSTPPVKLIKNFVYYVVYPNINTADQIFKSLGTFSDNIKSIVYIHQENLAYKKKNQELSDKLRNYDIMLARYERAVNLLEIPKIKDKKSVTARVSVREPNEWYQWFIIDKGENSGLSNEMPVTMLMDNGELCAVGRTVETYKNSSKVALITNILSAVPVQVKGKKINCLAEGFNSGFLKITYIPLNANIEVGDEIITSPLSTVFSEGIAVGTILSISEEPTMDFQTAISDVKFDYDTLYEAVILVPDEDIK